MMISLLHRGQLVAVPSVERALAFLADDEGAAGLPQLRGERRRVVGTPASVRAGLEAVAAEYAADEVMVVTITYDHAARRRSYELIAEEFGLAGAARSASAAARA
jgi:alkanesulfonate monooxygenase SsuD/methylene tetrahydromethanopterin reductase-like flavin-dependent oxidoreductase (luciferase family)